jgi:hypothetical protein
VLTPTRALTHPLWIAALLVLACNDHVLKGSEPIPSFLTGKLSDIAGLLVAPSLFAIVARARSRWQWVAVHVAVGVVFAALQLWAWAADTWARLFEAIGIGWHTTPDPGDLVALPMLALSWRAFRPVMRGHAGPARMRVARAGLAAIGLLCCAASGGWGDVRTFRMMDVYVHNAGERPVVIRIRGPRAEVRFDCEALAEDPARLLTETIFGTAQSWSLAGRVSHPLVSQPLSCEWENDGFCDEDWGCAPGTDWFDCGGEPPEPDPQLAHDCGVVWFDADGVATTVVFWDRSEIVPHEVELDVFDPDDVGGFAIEVDDEGNGSYSGGAEVRFAPATAPRSSGTCAPQPDGARIDADSVPAGVWTIADVAPGPDGCWALDLQPVESESAATRGYACVPVPDLPFAPGDTITVSRIGTSEAGSVVIRGSPEVAEVPAPELHLVHGGHLASIHGLHFEAAPVLECALAPDERCGTVARAASISISSGASAATTTHAGESASIDLDDGGSIEVLVVHAQHRVLVDPECAAGPDALGFDLELAAVYLPAS